MGTIERTLTLDKKLVRITVEPDGRVIFSGHAVDVASGLPIMSVAGDVRDTLTTAQKRAVADLILAGEAWVDAQDYTAPQPLAPVVPPLPLAPMTMQPNVEPEPPPP